MHLGERLFNDKALSGDDTLSCASCHHLAEGGEDGLAHSLGFGKTPTRVNTPTIFNVAFNFRQFWDGHASDLPEQAMKATHDVTIMHTNWDSFGAHVRRDPDYEAAMQRLYPGQPLPNAVADALAAYEATLLTPNSRFDRYLRGDTSAITDEERQGYALFKSYGCASCHQGINIGGNMYQVLGVVGEPGAYFRDRGHMTQADLGLYNLTHREADKFMFKVPSLRNVALTAPYLHDGSAATLDQVVSIMFHYQLGRTASPKDLDLIVKFLKTLTGTYNGKPLQAQGH